MSDYEVLNKINSPADVKKLNAAERKELAAEMRAAILNRVSKIGGHLGPNLGTVELAIALHTVFDSPKDKIILDVSHQSYPHKLLTGRRQGFQSDEHFRDISGYTNPQESEHDVLLSDIRQPRSVWLPVWPKPGICRDRNLMLLPLSATARFPAARLLRGWTMPGNSSQILS